MVTQTKILLHKNAVFMNNHWRHWAVFFT